MGGGVEEDWGSEVGGDTVVSRRWKWVESMGVVSGCGCKEVNRFPHITYPYSSCIYSILQKHPHFCSFKNMFFVLVQVLFVIY